MIMDIQSKIAATTHHKGKGKGKGKGKRKDESSLKVVYISSPMKVRTSVARFRSLVHQLTGKNSDIGPYLDCHQGGFRDLDGTLLPDRVFSSVSNSNDISPTNVFATKDQFGGFFSLDSFSGDDLIM